MLSWELHGKLFRIDLRSETQTLTGRLSIIYSWLCIDPVTASWSEILMNSEYCHIMMHDARDLIHSLLQSEICKLIYKNINNIHIIRKIVSQNWLSICVYLISPQIKLSEVLISYYIKSLLGFLNNVYMLIYLHSHVSPMLAPWIFLSGTSPIACVVWKLSPGIYSFIIHSNRWYITKCST